MLLGVVAPGSQCACIPKIGLMTLGGEDATHSDHLPIEVVIIRLPLGFLCSWHRLAECKFTGRVSAGVHSTHILHVMGGPMTVDASASFYGTSLTRLEIS